MCLIHNNSDAQTNHASTSFGPIEVAVSNDPTSREAVEKLVDVSRSINAARKRFLGVDWKTPTERGRLFFDFSFHSLVSMSAMGR